MPQPSLYTTAPKYFHKYFDLTHSDDLIEELRNNKKIIEEQIANVPAEKWHFAYAEGKWTVAEVYRHIIETERIFAYRALRLSRMDHTPLAGFDENAFISNLGSMRFSQEQLLHEFSTVREATISLYASMSTQMLRFEGNANGLSITAEMYAFMIAGHGVHHANVVKERY